MLHGGNDNCGIGGGDRTIQGGRAAVFWRRRSPWKCFGLFVNKIKGWEAEEIVGGEGAGCVENFPAGIGAVRVDYQSRQTALNMMRRCSELFAWEGFKRGE